MSLSNREGGEEAESPRGREMGETQGRGHIIFTPHTQKIIPVPMFKENRGEVLHGILLVVLFSLSACYIADFQWVRRLSLSPLIVGIILGMLYANSLRNKIPETWVPGLKFCTKQILRMGIVLYGFRLTFSQVLAIGPSAIVYDVVIICGTLALGLILGKVLQLDRHTTLLTSTGSAICGAAAVLGAEPVVRSEPHKTAIAVSTVVIFGTLSMFLYPLLFRSGMLHSLSNAQVAVYTGGTLHEVAHVAGAGNAIDPTGALGIAGPATITKMIRVVMLAPVLIVMACFLKRPHTEGRKAKITVPWFALGFILVILLNTLLQSLSFLPHDFLSTALYGKGAWMEKFDTFLLTMAMTALGADTSIDKFKKAGAKPFYLAFGLYLWLVIGGYFLAKAIA